MGDKAVDKSIKGRSPILLDVSKELEALSTGTREMKPLKKKYFTRIKRIPREEQKKSGKV